MRAAAVGTALLAGAAALLVNLALTFENLWPTPWVRPAAALSVEAALLVLGIAWLVWRGAFTPRVRAVLAGLVVVMALTRYAEVTALALYGRPVNLYWDAQHLPRVAAMLATVASPAKLAAAAAATAVGLLALGALARWMVGAIADGMHARGARGALAGGAAAVVALYAAGSASDLVDRDAWFVEPVTAAYVKQAGLALAALRGVPPDEGRAVALPDGPLAAIGDADVFLVFLESYGAATYTLAAHRERLADARADLAAALTDTHRSVVSAYFTSPTFGGASWLAHSSVLSGRETRTPDAYNRLVASGGNTLVHVFAHSGRRTVALMPGLRQDWPEGAFYGFDTVYGSAALQYRGPAFGWWRIPDQYALAKFDAIEAARAPRQPLFVFFPTITSHAPFRPTPPYQPEWARMTSDAPYDPSVRSAALQRDTDWDDLAPAYADAVGYTLRTLAGFLRHRSGDDVVLVVLGDHQPPGGVAGEKASWDVPVHVIASRPAVLDALVAAGFTPGLEPRAGSTGPLHGLGAMLLNAFSGRDPRLREARVDIARPGVARQLAQ